MNLFCINLKSKNAKTNDATRDVVNLLLEDAVWLNDHVGSCTTNCHGEGSCPAMFLYNGALHVSCVNPHCQSKDKSCVVTSRDLQRVADAWSKKPNRKRNTYYFVEAVKVPA